MSIKLKRVYDPPTADDGQRFLADRLWPRGLKKEEAHLAGWLRELAPSDELRRWFGHEASHWAEFQRRYKAELETPEKERLLRQLAEKAQAGTVTLVFAARDSEHNNALVLKEILQRR